MKMERSYCRKVVGQLFDMKNEVGESLSLNSLYEIVKDSKPGDIIFTGRYEIKINDKSVCIRPRFMKIDKWRILKAKEEGWVI